MENPECCEACGGEDPLACPLHGELEVVEDSPVPSLAHISLPKILALGQSGDSQNCGGTGVLAAAPVQPRTRFGPLIAPLDKKTSRRSRDVEHLPDYDLIDEDRCNWMALVRPAECQEEQNLVSVSQHSRVFYVATRMIPEGEELRVWYAPWYAQKHSLPMLPQTLAEHQQETDSMDVESGAADGMEVAVTECTENARDPKLAGNARKRSSSSNSPSRSSSRQKKNTGFRKKNREVNNSKDGLQKRLPLASSTVELRSRSGRKLKPNWKYPTADTNDIKSVHPRKQRKRSAGGAAVKKTPLVGKASKSSSPAPHNRDVHTPIQTSLDVLISAMEHNQNEIHTQKVKPIADPGEAGTEEPKAESSPAATVKSKKSRKRQCQYCKETFLGEEAWRTHEAQHTGEDPYVCEVEGCGKGFSSKFKHWRHQMTHRTPSNKQCPYCSKCFHRADHLKKHVQTHDVFRKLHTCERCGTGYKSKESYVYHMAVHQAQEDEALVCSLCPLQAASRQELLAHLKAVHHKYKSAVDAPKPFSCQLCEKSFTTKKDMHRHTLVHNTQRSFLCEFCAQSFRRKDHLQRHLHSNHKSLMLSAGSQSANSGFVCQLCQCSFSRKDHLTSHNNSIHGHAALQEEEATPVQADGTPGNGDLQPSAASEVFLIELKNVSPSELHGGGDWSGAPGAGSVQTIPLTPAPQGWSGGLAVPVPQPSLLAGMQSQGHGATRVMEVQQQQQQPLPQQTLVHHLQVQQQAVQQQQQQQQQHLQLLPVQQQPKQEQPQLLQSLLQRQQEQQQQQQQGQQQQQERQQWQQQQGQQQQQQQQEQLQQGQRHQKGQENLVSVTLTFPEEAFQKQGNSSLPQLQLTQPECCSPDGFVKAVFRPPSQPSDTGRQVNGGSEVKPSAIFSAVSTPQEETNQILSNDSVPKSQQFLSNAHTTSTMPAQITPEGASGGCCADSELGQRKCMLTTLGFHTTQLKTEICDPCPIMDAVSLDNSCQMAPGTCCSSDKGRPTGPPPTPVSPSVSGQLLANQAAPITYAQNLPSSRGGASAACMFSQAGGGDSGPLNPGEWPALPAAVVGSSLSQGGQTYIPECEVVASVSQSMSSSRLFPQAFPIRGQGGLQLNSLDPASSQQRRMLTERTATSQQGDTAPETNFLRAYVNDPGGESVAGSTACPLPSNISLQDVDVAFYTSVPNGMTSIAASTTTCLVQSPLLAVGNSMPGAAGVVVSSSVYPTSSEASPVLALRTPVPAAPETGTQESLDTRQLLWELSGRQGCSDHCYATTDGGIKSSEDPPPSAP